jgi:hypothetical protein
MASGPPTPAPTQAPPPLQAAGYRGNIVQIDIPGSEGNLYFRLSADPNLRYCLKADAPSFEKLCELLYVAAQSGWVVSASFDAGAPKPADNTVFADRIYISPPQ